jgi:hypothetical protein
MAKPKPEPKMKSSPINQEELAICRQRGHVGMVTRNGWSPCAKCGMWLRETIIEREDEPPEEEIDPGVCTDRKIAALHRTIETKWPTQ